VSSARRAFILATFLCSAAGLLFAQFPMSTQRPPEDITGVQMRELVSKYCRLDYEGGRLDPKAWSKFQPIVWWNAMPEVTKVNVVARYTVDPEPTIDRNKASITVHYRVLGMFDPALGYVREPEGTTQDVYFSLTQQNTEWRIADADNTLPHPSRAAMLKWLTQQIGITQDEAVKTRYQRALETLQQQSASPFAK
jgi:hypothetical protein